MAGETPIEPTKKPGSVRVFNCPGCGGGITVRASGFSLVATCNSCHSVVNLANENYVVLSRFKAQANIDPIIPLGRRGKLRGEQFEVVGFMQRCDASGNYKWEEYLLFNPYKGFRWLVQDRGHWNYVITTKSKPEEHPYRSSTYKYLGKTFKVFNRGSARVTYVLGEFYWQVAVNDQVEVEDSISPPQILSKEQDASEVTWSLGEYIEPDVVKLAFLVEHPMPQREGVAPNQADAIEGKASAIYQAFWVFAGIAVFLQMASNLGSMNHSVFDGNFVFFASDHGTVRSTEPFDVPGAIGNLKFKVVTNARNTSLDLKLALIEQGGAGKTYRYERELGFYDGRDSDGEYWAEGSTRDQTLFSSIPGGTYVVTVEAEGAVGAGDRLVELTLIRGVPIWSNFWFTIFLLSLFPVILYFRNLWFEGRRWSESDLISGKSESSSDD